MTASHRVTLIEGDGIGPEISQAVLAILEKLGAPITWDRQLGGLPAIAEAGEPLPQSTLASIRQNGLALKGPLTTPVGKGFRSVNVTLRQAFDLYANVRPCRSLLPGGRFENIDLVVVRENIQGLYAAMEHYLPCGDDPHGIAYGAGFNSRTECARIVEHAFEYALTHGRKKVTLVHKANILKLFSGLFLEEGRNVAARYADRIACDERIVDACAMQLVTDPWQFDVIVTTNLFGDILSDLTAGLVGGLGLAPGANYGPNIAIFEAVHGSAPDIAGLGCANPIALLSAAQLLLTHIGREDLALRLQSAVETVLCQQGIRTRDLGGHASTQELTNAIIIALEA